MGKGQQKFSVVCFPKNFFSEERIKLISKERIKLKWHKKRIDTIKYKRGKKRRARTQGGVPKPHGRAKGYRKISLSNHEIAMPKVPIREDVEVHLIPDAIKNILDVRIWWKNRRVHTIYPLNKFPRVLF